MNVEQFKTEILHADLEKFLDDRVLNAPCSNFSEDRVERVKQALAARYGVSADAILIYVVGSAKFGFALFERRLKTGTLPRFRPFGPDSDIDLAVVSRALFEAVWDDISTHANKSVTMPWNSEKLGDYMVHGWLRPDHFPRGVRLRRCDDWWDVFRAVSADSSLGRRKVRGALYHSVQHLRRYQLRGLAVCRAQIEAQL